MTSPPIFASFLEAAAVDVAVGHERAPLEVGFLGCVLLPEIPAESPHHCSDFVFSQHQPNFHGFFALI